ncbi:hypothetical protein ACIPIC_02770 [Streptomyces collinus]|uniref:hypothetical protein n=1 Tax=Streptomyces collinus TaxID=42684 RepID=UPI00382DEB80
MSTDARDALHAALGPHLAAQLTGPQAADAYHAFRLIADAESPAIARAWLIGMNPDLADASPLTTVLAGRTADVMAAARAYIQETP